MYANYLLGSGENATIHPSKIVDVSNEKSILIFLHIFAVTNNSSTLTLALCHNAKK